MYRKEYLLVEKAVAMRRHIIKDGLNFEEGADMKPLYEMSEIMQTMLVMGLNEEETTWFKSKTGGLWFAREFPVFALREKI